MIINQATAIAAAPGGELRLLDVELLRDDTTLMWSACDLERKGVGKSAYTRVAAICHLLEAGGMSYAAIFLLDESDRRHLVTAFGDTVQYEARTTAETMLVWHRATNDYLAEHTIYALFDATQESDRKWRFQDGSTLSVDDLDRMRAQDRLSEIDSTIDQLREEARGLLREALKREHPDAIELTLDEARSYLPDEMLDSYAAVATPACIYYWFPDDAPESLRNCVGIRYGVDGPDYLAGHRKGA